MCKLKSKQKSTSKSHPFASENQEQVHQTPESELISNVTSSSVFRPRKRKDVSTPPVKPASNLSSLTKRPRDETLPAVNFGFNIAPQISHGIYPVCQRSSSHRTPFKDISSEFNVPHCPTPIDLGSTITQLSNTSYSIQSRKHPVRCSPSSTKFDRLQERSPRSVFIHPYSRYSYSERLHYARQARWMRYRILKNKRYRSNTHTGHSASSSTFHSTPTVPTTIFSSIQTVCSESEPLNNRRRLPRSLLQRVTPIILDFQSTNDHSVPTSTTNYTHESSEAGSETSQHVSQLFSQAESIELDNVGDASCICRHCNAIMWLEERIGTRKRNPDFSLCCMKGKVHLPILRKPPRLLYNLLSNQDRRSRHFKENIRAYNSLFSFTSIGGKVESEINNGSGPPQFILSGQNYHRIGSLVPSFGATPKFAQLYIYDTQNEISNRLKPFSSNKGQEPFDRSLISDLTTMIDKENRLVQLFRMARDFVQQDDTRNFYIRLYRNRSQDPRTYNVPTVDEVAALIVGDFDNIEKGRDIIVSKYGEGLKRIHETHPSFIPLQYPLLFPFGEDGFREGIPLRDEAMRQSGRKRKKISLREFLAFRIQERNNEYGNLVNTGRLFQQFVVDSYTMVESNRLSFIRHNQTKIRSEMLKGLKEAVNRGDIAPSSAGKRVVLPPSFHAGPRYMFNNCQDALAICKRFGYPDLFITMTCNANWKEIREHVSVRGLRPEDRPDIVSRVFKMKLRNLLSFLKKDRVFGEVIAGMHTIEFQKRGLPHAHILIWLSEGSKLKTGNDIDKIISAELPDPTLYPALSNAVSNFMMHGPCGLANKISPCMKCGHCEKHFPKDYEEKTRIDDEGYPKYRRRRTGIEVSKKGVKLDNRYVVPYSPKLLMKFKAHINVEYCNKSNAIKYLFKYVIKGPDRISVEISNRGKDSNNDEVVDEIKQYYDCRYLSPCEATWRMFEFTIHERWPPVTRLSFHLPNEQSIAFTDYERIDKVVERNSELDTMFLAWFEANRLFEMGRHLTYAEFPQMFVYDKEFRKWTPREKGFAIGRLTYIPIGCGEIYYMRLLLTIQTGCKSYDDIKRVNGVLFETFRDACYALGLLADDKEFIDGIKESSELASGQQLRRLFATLLSTATMSRPDFVWESTWKLLADGIEFQRRNLLNMPGLIIPEDQLKNLCLVEIEKIMQRNGRSLKDHSCLPYPSFDDEEQYENKFIVDELNYDKEEMTAKHYSLLSLMTNEQKGVYDKIMHAVMSLNGGFFFLYGYGGTGKTFVWNTLSAAIRSMGMIVLNVASSGIASLLLPGGRTAHSRFCIPLVTDERSTCNIKQGSLRANLLKQAKLIIWDEAPMLNKNCFEALDRTLRDIMSQEDENNSGKPFGGKVVVLGGDFRQILPVIPKGGRQDIVSAAVNSSELWKHCKVLKLTRNMRLGTATSSTHASEIKEFADWLLKIGDGEYSSNERGESDIEIPEDLLISDSQNPLQSLVDFAYPDLVQNKENAKFLEQRCILCPTLETVQNVNDFILDLLPGDTKEYLSSDTTCKSDEDTPIVSEWFTTEFLNDISCSGIPNHKIKLKKGAPIMLLRNIDQAAGLCNGTRLIVDDLGDYVIRARKTTGSNVSDDILIPRMDMVPSDSGYPFKFQRRQFPIALCFAMTINKNQGQSLSHVGLYLSRPVFTHDQLYVALSRVTSRNGLKLLLMDEEGKVTNNTKNVVYREVFTNM